MTITNGYTTLARMKAYLMPASAADASDDAVIESLVEQASRAIDAYTGNWFYPRTQTRKYVAGRDTAGRTLSLDAPLLTITSITNGNGQAVANYVAVPLNDTPHYAIRLTASGGDVWEYTDDPDEDLIEVEGTWGMMDTTEDTDIELACQILVADAYHKRHGNEGEGGDLVTPEGVQIRASGFPRRVRDMLSGYKRYI